MTGARSWGDLEVLTASLVASEPALARAEAKAGAARSWGVTSLSGLAVVDMVEALVREAHELALLRSPVYV